MLSPNEINGNLKDAGSQLGESFSYYYNPKDFGMREVLFTGCGFAFGFGWLWFSTLMCYWLPDFLWGKIWEGGGTSLFLIFISTGFFLFRVLSDTPGQVTSATLGASAKDSKVFYFDFRSTFWPHFAHGTSLLFLLLAALLTLPSNEIFYYLAVLSLSLSGLIQGIFWTGALLCLSPYQASLAFAAASIAAALLGLIFYFLPSSLYSFLFFATIIIAWWMAWKLCLLLNSPVVGPKRPRGRPSKKTPNRADLENGGRWLVYFFWLPWLVALAFFLMGLNTMAEYSSSLPAWLGGILTGCGAILGAFFCRLYLRPENVQNKNGEESYSTLYYKERVPFLLIYIPLAVQGMIGLLAPAIFLASANFFVGLICVVSAGLLAGLSPTRALRRGSLILVMAILSSNLGVETAYYLSSLLQDGPGNISFLERPFFRALGSFELLLAFILLIFQGRRFRKLKNRDATTFDLDQEDYSVRDEDLVEKIYGAQLTAREGEILELTAQNFSNKEIAARLYIQEATVRFHLRNIYQKTGLRERDDLLDLGRQLEQMKSSRL